MTHFRSLTIHGNFDPYMIRKVPCTFQTYPTSSRFSFRHLDSYLSSLVLLVVKESWGFSELFVKTVEGGVNTFAFKNLKMFVSNTRSSMT